MMSKRRATSYHGKTTNVLRYAECCDSERDLNKRNDERTAHSFRIIYVNAKESHILYRFLGNYKNNRLIICHTVIQKHMKKKQRKRKVKKKKEYMEPNEWKVNGKKQQQPPHNVATFRTRVWNWTDDDSNKTITK